jgi:DNA-binding transcriptional regulator LsrR (DeoR family)
MKPVSGEEHELLFRISWMYYFGSMNQQQIADELSLSRIKVIRLLQRALDLGVVHISMDSKNCSLLSCEQELKEAAGLTYCVVVPALPDLADALSRGAAHLCNDIIAMKGQLGIGLSRSIKYLYKYLDKRKCKVSSVISIAGSTSPNLALTRLNNGFQIAQALGVDYYTIWAPVIVGKGINSEAIKKDRYISMVLEMARHSDYVLMGIGSAKDSQLIDMKYITEEDVKIISASNVESEIMGRCFTIDGKMVPTGIEKRIISVDFPMECPVIGIAGGKDKEKAIVGALRSGWFQGLVTDEDTAKGILDLFNKPVGY